MLGVVYAALFCGIASTFVAAKPHPNLISRAEPTNGILIDPAPQPPLPHVDSVQRKAKVADFNPDDVQGDILIGMKKNRELFFFFTISNPIDFKSKLSSVIKPLLTSTPQALPGGNQSETLLNIAFSRTGLNALNVSDDLVDFPFANGHPKTAPDDFKDQPGKWVEGLSNSDNLHGVLLIASNDIDKINSFLTDLQAKLGNSIKETYRLQGQSRGLETGTEDQLGHEHFGFMDGISQPAINGFSDRLPGQIPVDPGQILLGIQGDPSMDSRPGWTKGGSFLAFRQLQQFVPEFDKFRLDNAIVKDGLTREQGAELLGARMVGRWKSGAPIQLAPEADDVDLANNRTRNNDFTFNVNDVSRCPFAAHIRKTNPRGDIGTSSHLIIRAGIPYGPEVTDAEKSANTSDPAQERGLAFVSYQSDISQGFKFIQQTWVNNQNFRISGTGLDPIIGTNGGQPFNVSGLDPIQPQKQLTVLADFVVSRGGEYFFSPPISAIDAKLAV